MDKHQFLYYILLTGALFHGILPRIEGVRISGGYPSALGLGLMFRLLNTPIQAFVLTPLLMLAQRSHDFTWITVVLSAALVATLTISTTLLALLSKAFPEQFELDSRWAGLKCALVLTLLRLLFPH